MDYVVVRTYDGQGGDCLAGKSIWCTAIWHWLAMIVPWRRLWYCSSPTHRSLDMWLQPRRIRKPPTRTPISQRELYSSPINWVLNLWPKPRRRMKPPTRTQIPLKKEDKSLRLLWCLHHVTISMIGIVVTFICIFGIGSRRRQNEPSDWDVSEARLGMPGLDELPDV